jgi:hypothetical protein
VPRVISITAKYTTEDSEYYPRIYCYLRTGTGSTSYLYAQPSYKIGDTRGITKREWRIPAYTDDYPILEVNIDIPSGVVLDIKQFDIKTMPISRHHREGIKYSAHHGVGRATDTLDAFQRAGELGFMSCTTTPQFTSDGVGVCFHDDTEISGKLRWPDGNEITGTDDKPVYQYTYDELLQFDAGIRMGAAFAGMKVPTLEDFFRCCSMYGMCPELGLHSTFRTHGTGADDTARATAHFQYVRNLAEKYNVLGNLWIKTSDSALLIPAQSVFQPNEIGGFVINRSQESTNDPLDVIKEANLVPSTSTTAKDSQYNLIYQPFDRQATDELIATCISEGFVVGVVEIDTIDGERMNHMIEQGVKMFCVNSHHCSMGLYW